MALEPRISLALNQPVNVGQRFGQSLQNVRQFDALQQQRQQAPFQNQLLQLRTELAQAQQPAMLQQAEQAASPLSQVTGQQQQMLQLATISAQNLKTAFDSNSRVGVISGLTALRDQLTTAGAPPQQIAEIEADIAQANTAEGFEALRQENQQFLQQVNGQQGTQMQRFNALVQAAQGDPQSVETQAAQIELGIKPRAATSAAERIAEDPNLAGKVAKSQANITGTKEEAKLNAQLKLDPQIAAAVDQAKFAVKDAADQFTKQRSDSNALKVYEVGIRNLSGALGQTTTGPIASIFTSLTDSARTADGAVAIMLPILKQMYRTAGEGTFTDKDQELLEAMLPTRKDDMPTIRSKLTMLDAAVRAKLGSNEQQEQTTQPTDLSGLSLEELMAERQRLGGQ